MPAIRTDRTAPHRDMGLLTLDDAIIQHESVHNELNLGRRTGSAPSPSSSRLTPPTSAKPVKRKKPSNAFILFRSHAISSKMIPKTVTHQNDVSRIVAELWRAQDSETRAHFFQMAAAEKLRCMMEEGVETVEQKKKARGVRSAQRKIKGSRTVARMPTPPPSPRTRSVIPACPALSAASSGSSGNMVSSPSLRYPLSPFDLQPPVLPRVIPLELPTDTSYLSSSSMESEADVYAGDLEPAISSLAFEWSSAFPASSFSLKEHTHEEFAVPADNALGLHFISLATEPELSQDYPLGNVFHPYPDFLYPTASSPVISTEFFPMTDIEFTSALSDLAVHSFDGYLSEFNLSFVNGDGALF